MEIKEVLDKTIKNVSLIGDKEKINNIHLQSKARCNKSTDV